MRGWTLVELSREAHVDHDTLSDFIHASRQPTLVTVQAIVKTLGLTMAETITFRGDRRPTTG
jgi:DNA-binding phage protein